VDPHGVFVYGSLSHPDELLRLLGHRPDPGEVQRATLHGYRRLWTVCTDNTDPARRVTYYRPGATGPEPIQVLFLAVVPDGGATTGGLLVRVDAGRLAGLDRREGNYVRHEVTGAVRPERAGARLPDAVWTYTAAGDSLVRAGAGIAAGTARIRREYLDRVHQGLAAHDLLEAFRRDVTMPAVPVVPLARVPVTDPCPHSGTGAAGCWRPSPVSARPR